MKEQARRLCYEPGAPVVACPSSMMRRLYFELLLKSLQIVSVDVGNGPVVEVGVNPMQKLIALARYRLCGSGRIRFFPPNKQVTEMFAPCLSQHYQPHVLEGR